MNHRLPPRQVMTTTNDHRGTHIGEGLTRRQILVVFSGLMMGLLVASLDQTIVATALPTIVGDLHGLDRLSWVVTAYLLTSTASTPLYGKISDLYGRRLIFQIAIVVFLIGSVAAGLSQNMNELIATRAVQGIGGGGLITLAMATVGDVVPPRQRGRYQGYLTSVFALSSVGGPLIGGFLVDNLSWRWIFYINVPIGIAALMVTSSALKIDFPRREHLVDYLGSLLLVVGVSCLLLVTVWGGTSYPWGSAPIIGTGAAAVVSGVLFVLRERVAPEPIVPLRLFGNSIFSVISGIGFIVGIAMFGVVVFLPLYLQLVKGVSPTVSGLLLVPLMAGILAASIVSGRLVSATGRYRAFALVGPAAATAGIFLLSHLGAGTNQAVMSAYLAVLGMGMGMTMPVLIIAVQNSVLWRDIGTATAGVNFFRNLGGSIGTAAFGAILVNRLAYNLPRSLSKAALAKLPGGTTITASPATLRTLPAPVQEGVVHAFVRSIDTVFLVAVPVMAIAFLLALFLKEIELRETVGHGDEAVPSMKPGPSEGSGPEQGDGRVRPRRAVRRTTGAPAGLVDHTDPGI